jgi:transposase
MIHTLKQEGLSISAIARRTGIDRKTVRHHLQSGITVPGYGPRPPRGSKLDPFQNYLKARVETYPELSGKRLQREITAMGYNGGYTLVTDYLRTVRPQAETGFAPRFETPAGKQAQVDFAQFKVCFGCEPLVVRVVWLFSMILGYSRCLFTRFVWRQTLDVLVRCHLEAFADFGGVPQEVLYDRMKTAVLGAAENGDIIYHPTLVSLAAHYGFRPRACRPYRAQTKGKVERPFRYVRQDFFLGGSFYDRNDLNAQSDQWRREIANVRQHGTTRRLINTALAEERAQLQPLPTQRFTEGIVICFQRMSRIRRSVCRHAAVFAI